MPRMTSEIAAHWIAPGTAHCSVTWSWIVPPSGVHFQRKRMKKSGVEARAPARMPMQWHHACCRGFAPSM